jgi:LacI family transcriptional regulator
MKKKRVTQADVARKAGVSRYTVSCVINNRSGGNVRISDKTRQHVLAVVEELGYQPNVMARGLRTNRTMQIAIMVPDLANPFYPLFVRSAQRILEESGYQILISDTHNSPERERKFLTSMLQGFVDGVISFSFYADRKYLQSLRDSGVIVEELTSSGSLHGEPRIATGVSLAIKEMLNFLIVKGHRRIAHLAGSLRTAPGRYRFHCYRETLEEAGIKFDESLVGYGAFRRREVPELMASLFKDIDAPDRPTALFAANDVMAIEALHWLIQGGWRVPEDVAVCGFDNIPATNVVTPSLTTIDQNPRELGHRTALAIINQIDGQENEDNLLSVPCKLVLRDST